MVWNYVICHAGIWVGRFQDCLEGESIVFQMIMPQEDLFLVLYWRGDPILTSKGSILELDQELLSQQTSCKPDDTEAAIYLLERTIDCLRSGSSDPSNPTNLAGLDPVGKA